MATIKEVAERAAVSTATVSRALNGGRVNPDLRARVESAVAEIGYRPNRLARGLRRQSTMVWGLVISDVRNPFFTSLARAVEDVANASGHSVVLCNSDEDVDKESRYIEMLVGEQVAGLILSPALEDLSTVDVALAEGIPVVAIDRRVRTTVVDTVLVDNHAGARDAVFHLVAEGARRIAVLVGDPRVTTARERLEGYVAALRQSGLEYEDELVLYGDFRGSNGRELVGELLSRADKPDALFVTNNLLTVGALEAIVAAQIEMPTELKVVGYDDLPLAALLKPGLSSVSQPTYDVGRRAAELLVERLNGGDGPAREVVLTASLEIRGSSLRA